MDRWQYWLIDSKKREIDLDFYLRSRKIRKEDNNSVLTRAHLAKAMHNLRFVQATIDLIEFNDWAIVGAYYSIYQASLALCASKGFITKDHDATLLILIKEFYNNGLSGEDVSLVHEMTLSKEDVLYYTQARSQRTKASYTGQFIFSKEEVLSLQKKAISFVQKVNGIINLV